MRSVFRIPSLVLLLLAAPALAQINPNTNIRWPQPSCSTHGAPYNPADNACTTTTTTGGLPTTNPQFAGTMQGPTQIVNATTSSVNGTLMVTAPPYNAKCDGTTDDQAAVQAAFNDALATGKQVQFPPGTCLFSTVSIRGQPFFGAGKYITNLKGKPGQDVFQGPDGGASYLPYAHIHDLSVTNDTSVDASATAAGGNNTFPYRVAGTYGGLTPIPASLGGPPAPGNIVFDPAIPGTNGSSCTAGTNIVTNADGAFTQIDSRYVVGAPYTLKGAGAAGADLVTTIASIISGSQVHLATNCLTTVSNAAGNWGSTSVLAPPWYFGNCAFAFPLSDATTLVGGLNGWVFENVAINGGRQNHTCGMFFQETTNAIKLVNVTFQGNWGQYIEALPYFNSGSLFAWTPDTSSFRDVDLEFSSIPAVFWNGTHRVLDGMSIYGGEQPYTLGVFMFGPNPSNTTFSHYYYECWSSNSGENSRFEGDNLHVEGSLDQCGPAPWVNWMANNSTSNAGVSAVKFNGNNNTFQNTGRGSPTIVPGGNGQQNRFARQISTSTTLISGAQSYVNPRPHGVVNTLDGGFLLAGMASAPFTSGSDLGITCEEFSFAFQAPGATGPGCTDDPTGTELSQSYTHIQNAAPWTSGFDLSPGGSAWGSGPYGKIIQLGDRWPVAPGTLVIQARCISGPCTNQIMQIYDVTTSSFLLNTTMTIAVGPGWTTVQLPLNLAAGSAGDLIDVSFGNPFATGGATFEDIAYIGFSPANGQNVVYRCTTAGTLPVGALTIATGNCGASTDTGLRAK